MEHRSPSNPNSTVGMNSEAMRLFHEHCQRHARIRPLSSSPIGDTLGSHDDDTCMRLSPVDNLRQTAPPLAPTMAAVASMDQDEEEEERKRREIASPWLPSMDRVVMNGCGTEPTSLTNGDKRVENYSNCSTANWTETNGIQNSATVSSQIRVSDIINPMYGPLKVRTDATDGISLEETSLPKTKMASIAALDELADHLHTLHSSGDPVDNMQLYSTSNRNPVGSNSGPSGGEEPTSLEVSSDTQRAMESSDGTPPSIGPMSGGHGDHPHSLQTHPPTMMKTEGNSESALESCRSTYVSHSPAMIWSGDQGKPTLEEHCGLLDCTRPLIGDLGCDTGNSLHHSNRAYSETHSSGDDSDEGMSMARFEQMTNAVQPDGTGVFFCHLCDFTGCNRQDFQEHLRSHYDYKCLKCDYTSRTEGRLKRHLKDFHSQVPPDNFSGKALKSIRPKLQRCKQCDFMTETKDEFWRHLRVHIKEEKRLECALCCFVTEYKHHLEYHMRNHMGSKPYKCPKCNYECVNKSMLNSHMKSHSNVYPYRCANCHYATKYCHSLKLHLAKHGHKPAVVLNADGSLPSYDNTMELMSVVRRGTHHTSSRQSLTPVTRSPSASQTPVHGRADGKMLCTPTDESHASFPLNAAHMRTMCDSINGTPFSDNSPSSTAHSLYSPLGFPMPSALNPFSGIMFPPPFLDPSSLFQKPASISSAGGELDPSRVWNSMQLPNTPFSRNQPFPPLPQPLDGPYGKESMDATKPLQPMMAAFLAAMQQNQLRSPLGLAPIANQNFPHHLPYPILNPTSMIPSIKMDADGPVVSSCNDFFPMTLTTAPMVTRPQMVKPSIPSDLIGEDLRTNDSQDSFRYKLKRDDCKVSSASVKKEDLALDLSAKLSNNSESNQKGRTINCTATGFPKNYSCKQSEKHGSKGPPKSPHASAESSSDADEKGSPFDYECRFCEIRFRQRALYDIHMGFHSHADPYLCNRCGHQSRDPVDFFIHVGQMAHYS